jgi:hypothetical protein
MAHSLHHHITTASAVRGASSVRIAGRTYPASQRNLVAASLLARPETPRGASGRLPAWSRP